MSLTPVALHEENDPGVVTLESEIRDVTPEAAQLWLREYTYQGQRTLRSWWVDALAKAMREGKFSVSTIDFCSIDGVHWWLTNGQHRLHGIVQYNKPVTLNILWKLVDDEEALKREYARADRGLQRTLRDAMSVDQLSEETNLNTHEIHRATQAVGYMISGFQRDFLNRRNPMLAAAEVRTQIIERLAQPFRMYFDALKGGTRIMQNSLERGPVCAVGVTTCRFQPDKAQDFWHTIAQDDGLARGSVYHTLREFIAAKSVSEYGGAQYARAVAFAWNAYFDGRSEEYGRINLYHDAADKPILIKGTPYDGKCVITMRDPGDV